MKKEITLSKREEIQALQDLLITKADGENIEGDGKHVVHSSNFPLKHTFADGVYVRQMDMKADSLVVGAIHNHLHVWFLLTGHLTVATEDAIEEFIAPCYIISPRGAKRVVYAMEDCTIVTVHANPTNTEDLSEIEKINVLFSWDEYDEYLKNQKNEKNNK